MLIYGYVYFIIRILTIHPKLKLGGGSVLKNHISHKLEFKVL